MVLLRNMEKRNIVLSDLKVSQLGLGCMAISEFYGPKPLRQAQQGFRVTII